MDSIKNEILSHKVQFYNHAKIKQGILAKWLSGEKG